MRGAAHPISQTNSAKHTAAAAVHPSKIVDVANDGIRTNAVTITPVILPNVLTP